MGLSSRDIATSTPEERLDLLERLWDSLTPTAILNSGIVVWEIEDQGFEGAAGASAG